MLHRPYDENYAFRAQLTLEQHFENLSNQFSEVKQLFSLWQILKKEFCEKLSSTRNIFIHFSLHDSKHSETIINIIEMFLGEDRIKVLSATDTFMLLCCSYAHDYGMALTIENVCRILDDSNGDFSKFLGMSCNETVNEAGWRAAKLLYQFYDSEDRRINCNLRELYLAIIYWVEEYVRPQHWMGVDSLYQDFMALFANRIKIRVVKNIIEICKTHCKKIDSIKELEPQEVGLFTDVYHPQFIAAMLRLGDALDLDNDRFPKSFTEMLIYDRLSVPDLSKMHYEKHEAITHYFVSPKKIEIVAKFTRTSSEYQPVGAAQLLADNFQELRHDCDYLIRQWDLIVQPDFGRPPRFTRGEIYVNGHLFKSEDQNLRLNMPQDKVLTLLKGSHIYDSKYVGIREVIQNAVDASLLQMWHDLRSNKYVTLMNNVRIPHDKKPVSPLDIPPSLFRFYDITVEVIKDLDVGQVLVVVKDRGISIDETDTRYMVNIGSSKSNNPRLRSILRDMPNWMKPSGVFGIGLQSVFQLTDLIEFYCRRPNKPEYCIRFYSYEKNRGRIEVGIVDPKHDKPYYNNSEQGTNVKFAINPFRAANEFQHYDRDFDTDDDLSALYNEIVYFVREEIRRTRQNYFTIRLSELTTKNEVSLETRSKLSTVATSFFGVINKGRRKNDPNSYLYSFAPLYDAKGFGPLFAAKNSIILWSDRKNVWSDHKNPQAEREHVHYRIQIKPCIPMETKDGNTLLHLPALNVQESYIHILYKFYKLNDIRSLFSPLFTNLKQYNSLNTGLFQIWVNLLDAPADKYLNIDRQRLREDSFSIFQVEEAQKYMFSDVCRQLVEAAQKVKRHETDQIRKKENSGQNPIISIYYALLGDLPMTASLFLLFLIYAELEDFRAFCNTFSELLRQCQIKVGEIFIPLEDFFPQDGDDNQVSPFLHFRTPFPEHCRQFQISGKPLLPEQIDSEKLDKCSDVTFLEEESPVACVLPKKIQLVRSEISEVKQETPFLLYDTCICRSFDQFMPIEMDAAACALDYLYALYDTNGCLEINHLSRKIFKPNAKFEKLIVNRFPKNFTLGPNFTNYLESNIQLYILSPFEWETAVELWSLMEKLPKDKAAQNGLVDHIMASNMLNKCCNYVLKYPGKRYDSSCDAPDMKEIKAAYRPFVEDICSFMLDNAELIRSEDFKILGKGRL